MIYQLFIISSLTFCVLCQYSNTLSTTPAPHPPAQVHYVNIGQDLAGDYKFGYDTGKGPNGQSFREETRGADGTVRGAYGYTDAGGQQRIVKYSAGTNGFKIEDDSPADSSGSRQAPAQYRAPAPTIPPQVYRAPQPAPQTYRAPSPSPSYSSADNSGNYLELNVRPAQTYRAPAPAQTLRQIQPSAYSSPSSSSLSNYLPSYSSSSGLSSGSLSSNGGSSISYPASQPSLQTYRPQSRPAAAPALSQPALRSYSGLGTTARPEEETWGPPVINTALLSYNIGSQGSLPVSYLPRSSSSTSHLGQRQTYLAPSATSNSESSISTDYNTNYNTNYNTDYNTPILRTYSGFTSSQPKEEEKWGPPVINTALLNYNIGIRH